jgi:ubiquinone/menaquinone biosynthesis C-methylase UbiE
MSSHRVCPWWIGYLLASPLRRLMMDPAKILAPYVREGMTVLEPGPGMGFFTIEIACRVGSVGRVVAADIQPKMLAALRRRLAKAQLLDRVDVRQISPDSGGLADLAGGVDLVFACAVVHEMPSPKLFFQEAARSLKAGGLLFLIEPAGHVTDADFQGELADADAAGLVVADSPTLRRSHAVVLKRTER